MRITEAVYDKRILIWGYGREGKSTERFLNKFCSPALVEVYEGKREGIDESKYDLIIKSPGIVMEDDSPLYSSQTQLFLSEFRDQVIGITGTKGKSTTSVLTYETLQKAGRRPVLLVGNIGKPCLDYYDDITEETIIVFEMSCHQLAHVTVSPHIAVFLNLYEEHLDYYGTLDKYFRAKSHISTFQNSGDLLFVGKDVPEFETQARVFRMLPPEEEEYELKIPGAHNQYNAEFVYEIATRVFGLENTKVREAMKDFTGLSHRLQKIAVIDGVTYYDDSISTIPEATMNAVNCLENVQTVLVGGMDRGINYDVLVKFIRKRHDIDFIVMYESGERLYKDIMYCDNVRFAPDLRGAVILAKQFTKSGNACILSPAAASYGYFKDFEERGEVFAKLVAEL